MNLDDNVFVGISLRETFELLFILVNKEVEFLVEIGATSIKKLG